MPCLVGYLRPEADATALYNDLSSHYNFCIVALNLPSVPDVYYEHNESFKSEAKFLEFPFYICAENAQLVD